MGGQEGKCSRCRGKGPEVGLNGGREFKARLGDGVLYGYVVMEMEAELG